MLFSRDTKRTLIAMMTTLTMALLSCERAEVPRANAHHESNGTTVGLALSASPSTRTSINEAADGFLWDTDDKISVWAKNSEGTFVLANQVFNIYSRTSNGNEAYFTSTLASPMAEGTYTYHIAYPVPKSVTGTKAVFEIPRVQDGKASSGSDITISGETVYKELSETLSSDPLGQSLQAVPANLHHLLHFLRFYIPTGGNLMGEPIQRIEFSMPQSIAGTITVDVTNPASATLSDGFKTITLDLSEPLVESTAARCYAVAGIFPPAAEYSLADTMEVTLYSENKIGKITPVNLAGRSFLAGHVTGVALKPTSVSDYYTLGFTLAGNNLGEEIQSIRLVLPEGSIWPETDSREYTYVPADGSMIPVGGQFSIKTGNEAAFRSLSQKGITAYFESEDALVSQSLTLPNLDSETKANISVSAPYLFFEDFSGLAEDFHSYDEYSLSSAGNKGGYSFLDGWSGGRVGGSAGTSIRISCRRETGLANYAARCDSPFMTGLKHTAAEFEAMGKDIELVVRFNYSMNRDGTPKIGQTMYFGRTNASGALSSGNTSGTFDSGFWIKETTGSWTNINNEATRTLSGMGNDYRLSWRTVPDTNWGPNNNTCYLYLDNIKVMIKK